MSVENNPTHLPSYQSFVDAISILNLPISSSELHGVMCGYLCAGATAEGEAYLRALTVKAKKDQLTQAAAIAMYKIYSISQQQLINFDFSFEMLLPDDEEPLLDRAQAFSEWCEGFTQGLTLAGIAYEQFHEEESQEALQHLLEFAQLDCESLQVDDQDEEALMEVSEYTRMAVLGLYSDLSEGGKKGGSSHKAH